jgi:energy-coupling factor transport system substrate-specific component
MRLPHSVRLATVLALVAVVLAAGSVLAGGAVLSGSRRSAPPRAHGAGAALAPELAFLAGAQNVDGGFGAARGQASSELYSAWAAIGLAAAGRNPLTLRSGGHTVLDAIRAEAGSLQGAGDLERTILALHACGVSTHSLGPAGDPVGRLLGLRAGDGSFAHQSNLTAFAILALRAAGDRAGNAVVRSAARWLGRQQDGDGGFGFGTRGEGSDVDDTAAVVQALVAAGVRGRAVARAAGYLVRAQSLDGGFPQQPGGASNAQSTAWAIQGLTAAGRDASRLTHAGSRSPVAYLRSLLAPDGSIRYSRTGSQTPVWVTAQALTGLAAKPLPIAAPAPPGGSSQG